MALTDSFKTALDAKEPLTAAATAALDVSPPLQTFDR